MTETPLDNSNERREGPIDRNPTMDCAECGRQERWQDIKDDGYRNGGWRVSNDPEESLLCPECNPTTSELVTCSRCDEDWPLPKVIVRGPRADSDEVICPDCVTPEDRIVTDGGRDERAEDTAWSGFMSDTTVWCQENHEPKIVQPDGGTCVCPECGREYLVEVDVKLVKEA